MSKAAKTSVVNRALRRNDQLPVTPGPSFFSFRKNGISKQAGASELSVAQSFLW
jgi:hypothetical protein